MELLKVILGFHCQGRDSLVVCCTIVLFKPELGLLLKRFLGILKNVEEGRQDLDLSGLKVTTPFSETALQVKAQDLPSAAKTIQELLSPARSSGRRLRRKLYCRIKKEEDGIRFKLKDGAAPVTSGVYTIYIPNKLTDTQASSPDLIRAVYPSSSIEKIEIAIENSGWKDYHGFARSAITTVCFLWMSPKHDFHSARFQIS
jgi:hypothetical protein